MGKSITPTYRVEYRDQQGWHEQCWKGAASDTAAERWRKAMNKSFQKGGANEHLAGFLGFIPHISHVRLVRQKTGEKVAAAAMPMFEV